MGHITAERLEECWNHLQSAEESLYQKNTPFDALRDCRLAMEDLYNASFGQNLQQKQIEESEQIEEDILKLRKQDTLETEDVEEIIRRCAETFDSLRGPILSALYSREEIDYEPEPNLENDLHNYSLSDDN